MTIPFLATLRGEVVVEFLYSFPLLLRLECRFGASADEFGFMLCHLRGEDGEVERVTLGEVAAEEVHSRLPEREYETDVP